MIYGKFFKRVFDFLAAFFALVVFSPVFVCVVILLVFANSGKPFFFQARPGKGGRVFRIIKFKTMNDKKDAQGNLLPDSHRLTAVGAFLRKTSLDEIPQLINVVIGDMSLIGPRPLLVSYLDCYNEAEMFRLTVRPGITGLTGVSGRNNISWYDKMYYDIKYVKELSFALDVSIFFQTIKKVLIREGISKDGHVTTDNFCDYCKEHPVREYDIWHAG